MVQLSNTGILYDFNYFVLNFDFFHNFYFIAKEPMNDETYAEKVSQVLNVTSGVFIDKKKNN